MFRVPGDITLHRKKYRGGSYQTPRSVPFGCILPPAENTVVVFLQPSPQGYVQYVPSLKKVSEKNLR